MCINNSDYPASLELRKVCQQIPDPKAEAKGFVRVIDESGEDYLFSEDCFVPVRLSQSARKLFSKAS
jgi:hypothetical protein